MSSKTKVMQDLLKTSVFALIIYIGVVACKHEPWPYDGPPNPNDTIPDSPGGKPCHPDTVYFENQILPLIQSNCGASGCHGNGSAQDGVDLTSYNRIINTADVRAGNPNGSDLYEVITETDPDKRMPPPPAAPLTAAQQQLIYTWILQGARNNRCDDCDTVNVKFSSHVFPVIQQNCQSCHGTTNPSGGVSLTNHAQVVSAVTNKNLLEIIKHTSGFKAMPPGAKMPNCEIRKIELWLNDGMPNN